MRERLTISTRKLEEINRFLVSEQNTILDPLVDIVEKYGGVKEINRKAHETTKNSSASMNTRKRSWEKKQDQLNSTSHSP